MMTKAWRTADMIVSGCITLLVRTHVRRWREVARDPSPVWDQRNRIIADFIPTGSAVLDIGCGAQSLKRYLKANCTYQPCDVVKSTPNVIVCDFNQALLPQLKAPYDFIVCSGVLEYMKDPKQFIELATSYGKVTLMSYHPLSSGQWKLQRLANNWVNHLPEEQLLRLFESAGLRWEVIHGAESAELLYRLQRV